MRISDWSSDVCSSDLQPADRRRSLAAERQREAHSVVERRMVKIFQHDAGLRDGEPGRGVDRPDAVDRKSVVTGKSVSVRVDLGGRRTITNNKQTSTPGSPPYKSTKTTTAIKPY